MTCSRSLHWINNINGRQKPRKMHVLFIPSLKRKLKQHEPHQTRDELMWPAGTNSNYSTWDICNVTHGNVLRLINALHEIKGTERLRQCKQSPSHMGDRLCVSVNQFMMATVKQRMWKLQSNGHEPVCK